MEEKIITKNKIKSQSLGLGTKIYSRYAQTGNFFISCARLAPFGIRGAQLRALFKPPNAKVL